MTEPTELFVLGDSISMHYGPYLRDYLAPAFAYARKGDGEEPGDLDDGDSRVNGGDSDACLAYLRLRVAAGALRGGVLLWNCGLHDVKTTDGGRQVPPERYRANLEAGLAAIQGAGARAVWARTTPALEEIHNARCPGFQRFHRDVVAYNEIADAVMRDAGVPVIDLYGFTLPFGPEAFCDHVHFTEEVRRLQAAYLAGHLLAWRADGKC